MRRILWIMLTMFAAGCATSPRPAEPLPAGSDPTPVSPAVTPTAVPEQVAPVEAPVVRRSLGLDAFAEANDEKLLQVYVGMRRATVERLMDGHQSGQWINPAKRQVLTGSDGKAYEVLFYLTRAPEHGRRVTENFLTPVIFRDERVVAIGRYPLKKLRRGSCPGRGGACS